MNMSLLDWAIVVIVMIFITYVALKTQKYVKGVADFCSANRCAGRYILGIARSEVGFAAEANVLLSCILFPGHVVPNCLEFLSIAPFLFCAL